MASVRGAASPSAFLERCQKATRAGVRGRREPEEEAGSCRYAKGKEQNRQIDSDLARPGQTGWIGANERLHAELSERETQEAARDRQEHAFGHRLSQESAAAGAKRGADREFTPASLSTRQEEIGEISAGNQQHEPNGRLQDPNRAAGVAKDRVLQRLHLEEVGVSFFSDFCSAAERVSVRPEPRALPPVVHERVQLCLCRIRRDAVLEAADERKDVVAAEIPSGGIQSDRQPDLCVVVHHVRSRRQDADDLAVATIDVNRLSY